MIDGSILNFGLKQKVIVFLPRGLVHEIKEISREEGISFSEVIRRRLKDGKK